MKFVFDYRLILISLIIKFNSIESRMGVSPRDCGLKKASNYIVNGQDARINEFPFIVLIKLNGNTVCGGAIINQYWVVTAAHCFKGREHQVNKYSLLMGASTIYTGDEYKISKIVVHEKFSFDTMNSDITLLKTVRKIKFDSKVGSICLPNRMYIEYTGLLTVAGWGRLYAGGPPSKKLQKVSLPIITDQECANKYKDQRVMVFRSNLCTFLTGHDTCEGDSGGPGFQYLNKRAVLVGIVSFGWECADTHPGAFTQVSYFRDWIDKYAQDVPY